MTEQKRSRVSNGRSSIFYSDAEGKWLGFVTMGLRPNGTPDRRKRTGKTEAEVTKKVRELERQRDTGNALPAGERWTVAQWILYWLDNIAAERVTEGTMSGYRPLVERHIIPGLGAHRLAALEPEHVEAFLRKLKRQGMAPATVLKVFRILSRALKVAEQRGRVRRNVCTLVDAPSVPQTEADALSADEARQVLAVALKDRLAARWAFQLEVGCRQGEALGIQWPDLALNLDNGTGVATIRRQLRRLPAQHGCGDPVGTKTVGHRGGTIERNVYACGQAQPIRCPQRVGGGIQLIPYPKSKKPRAVSLSLPLVLALQYHREAQDAERLAAGSFWTDDREFGPLVFRQVTGRRLDPRADFATWTEILETAGVKVGGTHLARHTNATLLLEAGVPTRVVAELLGHSKTSMTHRYQHVSAGMTGVASERIEGVLWQ
ncbi:MAG TPA: tyrosine-type recombinase/integrase [Kineosporiaceae bacterium]